MREYIVRVLDQTYHITAKDRYWAASQGVRLYLKAHPRRIGFSTVLVPNYNFTQLMALVSARLVHPEIPGRKSIYV